jgi:hypothetical protein
MFHRLLVTSAFLLMAAPALAAPQTYTLAVAPDGGLTGSGAEMLRGEIAHAQFILWGEDHGFADSPIVLRAIAHEARPLGFKYHVVEAGPLSTRMVGATLASDGIPGVTKLVHDVPLGLPFLSFKDDDILALDFLGRDANGTPYLWGVDQEFIGSPVFHLRRLVALAPNDQARAEANRLLTIETDAAAKADQQKFLLSSMDAKGFDALSALFQGQAEAENIIAELKESAAIYQAWMSDHNYENNAHRARLLASNFLKDYRAAAETEPKVVFKMGMEHTALGTTTLNVVDLGTLATSIARANGKTALRIAFLPAGGHNTVLAPKAGNPTAEEIYASDEEKEIFGAIGIDPSMLSKTGWTLIPLEPIRQSLDSKGLDALKPFTRFTLIGFDYVVTTPDAKPGVFLY